METEIPIKTKVICTSFYCEPNMFTYEHDKLLENSIGSINEKRTKCIIDYYFPIIRDRIIEYINSDNSSNFIYNIGSNRIERMKSKDSYYYEINQLKTEIHKFNFNFALGVDNQSYGKEAYIFFDLMESGNCCGSMFVYGVNVSSILKGLGLGKIVMKMIEDIAIANQTTNLMGISIPKINFTKNLIEKSNWMKIDEFNNRNSSNICYTLSKILPKYFEKEEITGIEL